ncbi:MAG: CRTAC1 family protein [Pseudomonadales bacterium]|nr:CRTAC1 family protein [Pseudomonadales bacterium]
MKNAPVFTLVSRLLLLCWWLSGPATSDPVSSLDDAQGNTDNPELQIAITINDASDLMVTEGTPMTLKISFDPGSYQGEITHYYLYADTRAGLFSYIHPGRVEAVTSKAVSAQNGALRFDNFELLTLPKLRVGEYLLHFEADIGSHTRLSSHARIRVIAGTGHFTEVSRLAGFDYSHGYVTAPRSNRDLRVITAGVAAGDYDNDGWVDLYISRGSIGPNLLFKNLGNGSFSEVGEMAGVNLNGKENAGVAFADYDGDGFLDLLLTGINGTQPTLFHNKKDATFEDVTAATGMTDMLLSLGASFADIDKDGDLDFWVNHWLWNRWQTSLWRNDGDGSFSDISQQAGIPAGLSADFTTNFADIDSDGWPDILLAGDFGTSQVLHNNGNATFSVITTAVISDENGMGAAVGDYDNDGDLDWFVSSIYDYAGPRPEVPWGASGNRFYQNQGDGSFRDVTDETGTRLGSWGWGSCFADFNNDSFLDLFHVNGYTASGWSALLPFDRDSSRLFMADQHGGFRERSFELGLIDDGQGRGVVCFDYDRDGDVDIFIANSEGPPRLFRNDSSHENHYLHVTVGGERANSQAIGARIYVTANQQIQMRELSAGSNYMSQNPVEAYFGLGKAGIVEIVRVVWPSGQETTLENVGIDQMLFVPAP